MTFTEAAVEVLRLVGKPLHYKKITEIAIERNMLSHVGKTPEVTMSSRLATMVKRDRGEAPIIKVKPGVFGLRDFTEEQLADLSGDIDELPEVEVENEDTEAAELAEAGEGAAQAKPEPRRPLPGADVFPEEDDDDEPILGGDDDEEDDDEGAEGEGEERNGDSPASGESRSQRRRKRKRRRGRGGEEASEDRFEPRRDDRSDNRRELRDRHERRDRDDRRDYDDSYDANREPADGDLLGKDLADAVATVLSSAGSRGLPAFRIADQLVRRGRLAGDPNALVPTVMAAVRADVARKKLEGQRVRFKIDNGALILTDFLLPQDVTRAEQEVLRAAERQRDRARRAFLRRIGELSVAGLAELLATWLNAEGVIGLRAVRRPGAASGELHFAGTLRRGVEEQRLAIVVCRDTRDFGRERVIEARGALHYYGHANAAWLITLGQVLSGAREEAAAPAAAPITLFDGVSLAAAMERVGVGLVVRQVPIATLDFELLDALRGPVARERDDRERDRDRDRDRDRYRDRDRERERDRGDRYERQRPREEPEVEEELEPIEPEDELERDERDDVVEGEELAAAEADTAAEQAAANGEPREGGRRRRRRRRRKGNRDRAAVESVAAAEEAGAVAGEADLADADAVEAEADTAEGDEDFDDERDEDFEEAEAAPSLVHLHEEPEHHVHDEPAWDTADSDEDAEADADLDDETDEDEDDVKRDEEFYRREDDV